MFFPSEEKVNNFIRFNVEEMKQEGKKGPVRSYFRKACGGWRPTSAPYVRCIKRKGKLKECKRGRNKKNIYDWKTHRKVVEETVGEVWTAYQIQEKRDSDKNIRICFNNTDFISSLQKIFAPLQRS